MADAQGAFVTRAFEKILKDSNARRFPKLHQALKAYLDRPKPPSADSSASPAEASDGEPAPATPSGATSGENAAASAAASSMAEAGHGLDNSEHQIIVVPLRLAVESKQSKLMETALDCIHKLIGYGHLQGDCGLEGGRNNTSNTELFQLVCNSADNTAVDTVVLQVIKVLLTAVASPSFQVHGDMLNLALRTLYNIVLNSKSHINVATARGTLTQMLNVVFKRMEVQQQKQTAVVARRQMRASESGEAENPSPMISPQLPLSHDPQESNGTADGAGAASAGTQGDSEDAEDRVRQEGQGAQDEAAAVLEAAGGAGGTPNLQALEAALDRAVQVQTPESGAAPSDSTQPQAPAGAKGSAATAAADRSESERGVALESLATMGQRDALLLFRTLCKMAMKDGTEDLVIRTKILSLQLLQGLLESVSDEFTVNFEFLDTVKMHLCYALVRACVSSDDRVFQCSCDIFSVLVRRYRESLKAEIGLFFPLMVLRPLDNADMTLAQRSTTLGMLDDLTADPQVLSDIFVNYDCDLEAKNLFERMVKSLARTAGSPQSSGGPGGSAAQQRPGGADLSSHAHAHGHGHTGPATATHVKTAAVQALVNVMRSLDTWFSKDKPELARRGRSGVSPRSVSGPEEAVAIVAEGQEKLGPGEGANGEPASAEFFAKVTADVFSTVDLSDGDLSAGGLSAALSQADQFEKRKAQKLLMEEAVFQFNMKPEKGVKFLVRNGLVQNVPEQVAQFLRSTPGLDKVAIGDYLGQHDDFQLSVMHRYCESVDFKGLKFDEAIRVFLQGFRLPGEAQKIDRIMEKFAERYCCDNSGIFKNADAAYVLAYAVIMLNTDAHNPVIAAKMTKADFVRMNAATNTEGGGAVEEAVPVPLLEEIYDSIVTNEIKLRDDDTKGAKGGKPGQAVGLTDERLLSILNLQTSQRKTAAELKAESDEIVKRTQALVKRTSAAATGLPRKDGPVALATVQQRVFSSASDADLARPMLETVGWPLVATVSMAMEDPEARHPRVVLCMEGLRLGIHLSLLMGLDTLRYAFLTSLVRYTYLHAPREMRMKNVEATRTLLTLAEQDPDALQDTWNAVLECVSRLEHIVTTPSLSASLMSMNNQVSRDALLAALQELAGRPLEQVFVVSSRLPGDAIVEFFTALCAVSAEELRQAPPRVFSLQKLVEISYYNMTRIRMIWAKIWALLSVHFIAAGQHPDQQVAMYAMDSIRQLALKYLERAELPQYTFQNDILKPFVVVMRTSKSELIREFILQCVVQMIKLKVTGIKSGWRSVFMVLTTAAADPYEPVLDLAFENAENVVLENFDQIVGDCFMDCVNCLMAFSNNPTSPRISLKAIALLRICEDRLAEGRVPGGVVRPVNEGEKLSDSDVAEYYWFPMLAGLSDLTSDPRPEVRSCAVEVLFDLLKERGHKFSTRFWESTFERILFPIFDYVRHAGSGGERPGPADLWLRDTSIHCLHLLCDLFCHFYREVNFELPSLLGLLLDCATRPDQTLAAVSVGAMVRLVDGGSNHFSEKDWGMILDSIKEAIIATTPSELVHEGDKKADTGGDLARSTSEEQQQSSARKERSPQLPSMIPTGETAAALLAQLSETGSNKAAEAGPEEKAEPNTLTEGNTGETAAEQRQSDGGTKGEGAADGEAGTAETVEGNGEIPSAVAGEEDPANPSSAKKRGSDGSDASGLGRRIMDALLLRNVGVGRPRSSSMASVSEGLVLQADPSAQSLSGEEAKDVFKEGSDPRPRESDVVEAETEDSPDVIAHGVRVKCYVQLLLLGALDRLQAGHWHCLNGPLRTQLADCVTLGLDFAVLYNNDQNFRLRMRQHGAERPPYCLLRQEALGTQLLLTVLLRALRDPAVHKLSTIKSEHMHLPCSFGPKNSQDETSGPNGVENGGVRDRVKSPTLEPMKPGVAGAAEEEEAEAERRLLQLCERVLHVSAGLQPGGGQAVEAEVHRSLALRSPIVSTVLLALSAMDSDRFERFAEYLYAHCTRLICSDQMDVRKALADLFRERLSPMVPLT